LAGAGIGCGDHVEPVPSYLERRHRARIDARPGDDAGTSGRRQRGVLPGLGGDANPRRHDARSLRPTPDGVLADLGGGCRLLPARGRYRWRSIVCGAVFVGHRLRWQFHVGGGSVCALASGREPDLLAASPLALASEWIGWRHTFLGVAGISAAVAVGFYLGVRDRPPGHEQSAGPPERIGRVLAGVVEVWRTPGLPAILAMHFVAYASMLVVLGLWAAPYLYDVHGLGGVARGHVLFGMAAAQVVGILAYGRIERLLGSRKRTVIAGALASVAVMAVLAAWPRPPLAVAALLLIVHCLIASYGIVIVAQGRSLFPDHLAGRGVTTVNLAQVMGCFILPILTGAIIGAFPETGGGAPEIAYRAAFAGIGLAIIIGLAAYSKAPR